MSTEEKLIALADAVLETDRIIALMPEMVPPGRNRELLLVPIEGAPVLAKALKLVLEQLRYSKCQHTIRPIDADIEAKLDALVKDRA
jgi:hypothetical protein